MWFKSSTTPPPGAVKGPVRARLEGSAAARRGVDSVGLQSLDVCVSQSVFPVAYTQQLVVALKHEVSVVLFPGVLAAESSVWSYRVHSTLKAAWCSCHLGSE